MLIFEHGWQPADDSMNNVFSTACSLVFLVPNYFEMSLKEIEAQKIYNIKFNDKSNVP